MRSGRLKDKITIQSQPDTTDVYGEELNVFNDVFSAKCDFKIMSGTEMLKSGLALNDEVASILMRFDGRLKYKHLVLHKLNRYEVGAIKPTKNNRDMIVTVSRQVI